MVPLEAGIRIHQFVIQQNLVGLLIGKQGTFVQYIKAQTGASVFVRKHPDTIKYKICAVEGNYFLMVYLCIPCSYSHVWLQSHFQMMEQKLQSQITGVKKLV